MSTRRCGRRTCGASRTPALRLMRDGAAGVGICCVGCSSRACCDALLRMLACGLACMPNCFRRCLWTHERRIYAGPVTRLACNLCVTTEVMAQALDLAQPLPLLAACTVDIITTDVHAMHIIIWLFSPAVPTCAWPSGHFPSLCALVHDISLLGSKIAAAIPSAHLAQCSAAQVI